MPMKTRIQDIAKTAGCSLATVSSILGGGGTSARYSPATRKKVLTIAEELNYKQMAAHNFAFVYCTGAPRKGRGNWMSGIAPMLESAQEEAQAVDKILSYFCFSTRQMDQTFRAGKVPPIFRRRKIDGLILAGRVDEEVIEYMSETRLPFVLMNVSDAHRFAEDSVCFDEIATGVEATRYLLGRGHRRVLNISVRWNLEHYSDPMRRKGYEMAMQEAGLASETIYLVEEEYGRLREELETILARPERPTAMVVHFEWLAVFCHRLIQELGLSRSAVEVISPAWSAKLVLEYLGIPYVELPAEEMGKLGFNMLRRKVETGESSPTISLRGKVRVPDEKYFGF